MFYNCTGLTSVTIGSSVTSIGKYAFDGCTSLSTVRVDIKSPLTISNDIFPNRANATLYVPRGCKVAYEAADYWKEFKEIIEMGDTSPTIITFADAAVKALCVSNWDTDGDGELSKDEAEAVTDIGNVFRGNTSITSFDELQHFTGLTSIGDYAFARCTSLTSLIIPESVTSIGNLAFSHCSGITRLEIPEGMTSIGSWALEYTGLKRIVVPNTVTSIGEGVFWYCSSLTSATLSEGITELPGYILGHTGITSFTIPSKVTSIGVEAMDFSPLTSITIPNSVTSIGTNAFRGCTRLTSATIGSGVTTIGGSAFFDCERLTSISIPHSVTSIGHYAFVNCTALSSVTIGSGVTSIGEYAFYGCKGLTKAEFASIESMCGIGFGSAAANPLCYAKHLYIEGEEVTSLTNTSIFSLVFTVCIRGAMFLRSISGAKVVLFFEITKCLVQKKSFFCGDLLLD